MTVVHVGTAAHQNYCLSAERLPGQFAQALQSGGEVGNLDLVKRALVVHVSKLPKPQVALAKLRFERGAVPRGEPAARDHPHVD